MDLFWFSWIVRYYYLSISLHTRHRLEGYKNGDSRRGRETALTSSLSSFPPLPHLSPHAQPCARSREYNRSTLFRIGGCDFVNSLVSVLSSVIGPDLTLLSSLEGVLTTQVWVYTRRLEESESDCWCVGWNSYIYFNDCQKDRISLRSLVGAVWWVSTPVPAIISL